MISAVEAARVLCEKSGWKLTNLQLQKMLYIAHMTYMGERDGEPLISGMFPPFEAWEFGPVSPTAYRHVKTFGAEPIGNVFRSVRDVSDTTEGYYLQAIYGQLKGWTPGQLVAFTHREGGAWEQYYRPGYRDISIPDEAVLDEYRRFQGV